jgi:hypothetical protein
LPLGVTSPSAGKRFAPAPPRTADFADDIQHSAVHRRDGVFPYTSRLTQLPVLVDFPVFLWNALAADASARL